MEKIKAYRLTFLTGNGKKGFFRYVINKDDAVRIATKWPEMYKLSKKRVTLFFDHSAKRRGYICKDSGYFESYNGNFGIGVIYHQPNCEYSGPRYSNNYHKIFYYLVK